MADRAEVTIIIPHWKGEAIVQRCLSSLQKTDYPDFKILIVNNACPDGSIETIKQDFPEVLIVDAKTNLGYAGGCNL